MLTSIACSEGELRNFTIDAHGSPSAPFGIVAGGLLSNVEVVPCDRLICLEKRETDTRFFWSHVRILPAISAGSEGVLSPGLSTDSTVLAAGSVDENL